VAKIALRRQNGRAKERLSAGLPLIVKVFKYYLKMHVKHEVLNSDNGEAKHEAQLRVNNKNLIYFDAKLRFALLPSRGLSYL